MWFCLSALKYNACSFGVEMLAECLRKEKEANIKPDPDVDIFIKVLTCLNFLMRTCILRKVGCFCFLSEECRGLLWLFLKIDILVFRLFTLLTSVKLRR